MGRHAAPRRLSVGQLVAVAVAGAVVAGAAGAGVLQMAGGGSSPYENASSAVTSVPSSVSAAQVPDVAASGSPGATATPGAPPAGPWFALTLAGPTPSTQVVSVAGSSATVTRRLTGLRPVRWFADGTLLLDGGSGGRRETAVYDPGAGRFLARRPYVVAGVGLPAEAGPGAAPQSFFVPGRLVAAARSPLAQRVPADGGHDGTLVEVSSSLTETRVRLPGKEALRAYRTGAAVRAGGAVFVPYAQSLPSGADGPRDGVLRMRGPVHDTVLADRHIQRLALSGDYRHLLALARAGTGPGLAALRLLQLDPGTGGVLRSVRLPALRGPGLGVGRLDLVAGRLAVEVGRGCAADGRRPCAGSSATYRWQGGRWVPVPGAWGRAVFWQADGASLAWRPAGGAVVFARADEAEVIFTRRQEEVVAAGGLLEPA